MSTQKNKKNIHDVFEGLKYIDALMTESAKTEISDEMKNTFENKLKAKLLNENENVNENDNVNENRFDNQNYEYPNYQYEDDAEAAADAPDMGGDDMAGDADAGLDAPAADDMGGDLAGGDDMAADMGDDLGADMGGEADADMGSGEEMIDEPEDIEALVDELIDADIEEAYGESDSLGMDDAELGDPAGNEDEAIVAEKEDKDEDDKEELDEMKDELDEADAVVAEADEAVTENNDVVAEADEAVTENNDVVAEADDKDEDDKDELDENSDTLMEIDDVVSEMEESVDWKDAGVDTLKNKVSDAGKKVDQTKAQGDAKAAGKSAHEGAKEAGTDEPTSKVSDTGKETTNEGSFSNVEGTEKVDQSKQRGDADKANKGGDYKDAGADTLNNKVSEMKKESVIKSKALFKLAEKYLALEDEHKALKFENYKALKANGILALAPDLSEDTRIALVQKFDECKTYKETKALYEDVAKMIKESATPSIDKVVGKDNSVNVIKEDNQKQEGELDKEVLTEAQKRILFLSGEKGFEDQYYNI